MTLNPTVKETPEFASLCSYIQLFGEDLNVALSQTQLATFLEIPNLENTPKLWIDIHRKLLNRINVKCTNDKWESSLKKFVNVTLASETTLPELYDKDYYFMTSKQRAKLLNIIFDCQFDKNLKFKEKVNQKLIKDLRVIPFGVDIYGCLYWLFVDKEVNIIMYKENLEEESFKIIAESIEEMRNLLIDLEKINCEEVDLSKLYIESVTPENTDSPNNDLDIVKEEPDQKQLITIIPSPNLKVEELEQAELNGNTLSPPEKLEETVDIVLIPPSSPSTGAAAASLPTELKQEKNNDDNLENDEKLVIVSNDSENIVLESLNEEIDLINKEETDLTCSDKKKRGRKPKVNVIIPVENESNLRRSERKRKPVNPFNIMCSPLSTKKSKIIDSQTDNIQIKTPESSDKTAKKKSKKIPHNKRGRPKKLKKHSDKESKILKKSKKSKHKIKLHKKQHKKRQPWETAESSEEHIEDEEEEYMMYQHEESDVSPKLKEYDIWNDKPESDFDADNDNDDEEILKSRGRNYFRQKNRVNKTLETAAAAVDDDKPCKICLRGTLPEMILLCDQCDLGHHAMCLKPSLMLIPEGDWFCPKCQHRKLIGNLSEKISELEKSLSKNVAKIRMQERLNFVNISMTNILSGNNRNSKQRSCRSSNDSSSPSYNSTTSDGSGNSSDASSSSTSGNRGGRYKFRESSRKEKTRYNFEEIDKIFDNALENDEKYQLMKKRQHDEEEESEESAPEYDYSGIEPRKKSSGKDMSNILEEEKKPRLRRPTKKRRLRYGSEDDDDFEDDIKDQDFKISDQSLSEVDDEEDDDRMLSVNDGSDSDDQWTSSRTRRSSRKGRHKRKGKKKVRVEFQDACSRPKRNAARKVNYLEMLGDEDEEREAGHEQEDDESADDNDSSKPPPVLARKKSKLNHRRRKISDSEYEESKDGSASESNNGSGSTVRLQSVKRKRKSCLDSDSGESGEHEDSKLVIEEEAVEPTEEPKVERISSVLIMNPMRATDDQNVDVENEVESEAEGCDSEMLTIAAESPKMAVPHDCDG